MYSTLWLPYTQMHTALPPLEVVATNDSYLVLKDGNKLVDGIASWWTACHGYNHPHIVNAISSQAEVLPHVMLGGLAHPQAIRLANRLSQLLPGTLDHVFFSSSGSVAVEIALKMALQYWINQNEPQRQQFIYFKHGYHGDTFLTMSVCDPDEGMHHLFRSLLPQHYCHAIPTEDDLVQEFEVWLSKHSSKLAALIIEPLVQGAGGMKMHAPGVLKALSLLCTRFGILFIADEIFTGFGRTGALFAIEQANIVPDILCLSKALSGGTLPLAATIACRHIYEAFLGDDPKKALMHGDTFMGNALACAAANACLDLFATQPRLSQVADLEGILKKELHPLIEFPGVKAVRVQGAIGVVQLTHPLSSQELNWFKQTFIQQGIWCRPFGDIVYTTPALTITKEALLQVTRAITYSIQEWSTNFHRR